MELFDDIVDPVEECGTKLESTWGLVKALYIADKKKMPSESYLSLHERARRARSLKYNSRHIYNFFKVRNLYCYYLLMECSALCPRWVLSPTLPCTNSSLFTNILLHSEEGFLKLKILSSMLHLVYLIYLFLILEL